VKLLLTGPPRVGKTTLVDQLVPDLWEAGVPVRGLVTREVREHGRRVGSSRRDRRRFGGFRARRLQRRAPGHVDVAALEEVAIPALAQAGKDEVVVIDELGQMELFSDAFVRAVRHLFDRDVTILATVHVTSHPVTDELKARADVELVEVDPRNRTELRSWLDRRLRPG
jgi:nucleoside-triphosphatase